VKTRQYLEKLSPYIGLIILTFGFFTLGVLTLTSRKRDHALEAIPLENGTIFLSGVSSILIGAVFLVAAYFYWNRYFKRVN
jgi:hypothetical protein